MNPVVLCITVTVGVALIIFAILWLTVWRTAANMQQVMLAQVEKHQE
uniref:Uncharacterized protein n=1 Tax=Anopheles albimanus TaxID=7167 RepID=A0A182FWL7_ANOAL